MDSHQRRVFKRGVRFEFVTGMSDRYAVVALLPNGKRERVGSWFSDLESAWRDFQNYVVRERDVMPFWLRDIDPKKIPVSVEV